jgi:hypothetical protein
VLEEVGFGFEGFPTVAARMVALNVFVISMHCRTPTSTVWALDFEANWIFPNLFGLQMAINVVPFWGLVRTA